jgi:hypothetical protein
MPEHVEDGLADMLTEGHAPAHVGKVLAILSSAFEVQAKRAAVYGMADGTAILNPCKFVEPPELGEANRKSLTRNQARAVLMAASKRGSFARWAIGLSCGVRQGEALVSPQWLMGQLSLPSCRTQLAPRGSAERQLAWPERQFT